MYRAPVGEIAFTLKHVAGLKPALDKGAFGELGEDVVDAVLEEAGRFATDEIAPLYKVGDEIGAQLKDGAVTTPPGWKALYRRWMDGGWNSLSAQEEHGGQALPTMVAVSVLEMWNSAAMAFGIGPTLTMGAVEALDKHASDALKEKYLGKLVSGEWMGTMNLTEPQAGSDLAALRTRAEPAGDGTYRIFGQKIFITYGEHDFTDNIVHLVLARLPDAPAGTRGISLFLVPKFLVGDDGSLGERNDVFCSGLEHKLGIHGSPTCTMIYGDGFQGQTPGAIGWLIGEENKGLACMFTMMNNARLAVGIQGVAIAETAYQKALAYANERRQGKNAGYSGQGMAPIVHHPDVQRNLLTMKTLTQAARAIAYSCAHAMDMARTRKGDEARHWQERANLLTPLAKAFPTDVGVEVSSLGVQIHGGMGFIEETGAAALYRDARIAPIYEGTNGIQAIDLVTRKLSLAGGEHVHAYIDELLEIVAGVRESNLAGFGATADRLDRALADLTEATHVLQAMLVDGRVEEALAGATPYLRLFSLAAGGAYLARGALAEGAEERISPCRFFAENLLGETAALRERVVDGGESLAAAARALVWA
ncbi:acyl-CoA dehydrogenase [Mesorhizobium sp. Root554]|uniref:acyl-CoA dehydrogenase n=1 Tax=unclassified Mesorhizobium TaxID=325217 RepID=UPI0006FCB95A|nr:MULTISPECIES: acyl-CoA dehydrogenase [unclassified Mesorhizobium]KQZ12829.1 acyl-CoA dehydrogenase [Mesorhizobium sp. Root1471]KQZ35349.1 acyl-CoA dehydrogenase [Mesorhizobium sp. Root554]